MDENTNERRDDMDECERTLDDYFSALAAFEGARARFSELRERVLALPGYYVCRGYHSFECGNVTNNDTGLCSCCERELDV